MWCVKTVQHRFVRLFLDQADILSRNWVNSGSFWSCSYRCGVSQNINNNKKKHKIRKGIQRALKGGDGKGRGVHVMNNPFRMLDRPRVLISIAHWIWSVGRPCGGRGRCSFGEPDSRHPMNIASNEEEDMLISFFFFFQDGTRGRKRLTFSRFQVCFFFWPHLVALSTRRHTHIDTHTLVLVSVLCTCPRHSGFFSKCFHLCLLFLAGKLLLQHFDAFIALLLVYHQLEGRENQSVHSYHPISPHRHRYKARKHHETERKKWLTTGIQRWRKHTSSRISFSLSRQVANSERSCATSADFFACTAWKTWLNP